MSLMKKFLSKYLTLKKKKYLNNVLVLYTGRGEMSGYFHSQSNLYNSLDSDSWTNAFFVTFIFIIGNSEA